MQFSKSTGYALHALIHLAHAERGQNVGIRDLSSMLGVSESYLSKIMSKLRQDGVVRAVTGVNGGYELARPAAQITFLEVIQVVEGRQNLFECFNANAERHRLFFEAEESDEDIPEHRGGSECLVKKVMDGAEKQMYDYLREHTIQWVMDASSFDADCAATKKR
ncbi:RrF2 family transcriptional regulator [Paenibacillus arenilitoris]|uniref:Rrf2 family transcriptional regulator n=1 Tax=Paenibacillus arenilitoris TaxID=2772299 RepID=A0A927H5Y7_9BACL|nr:Rrf2 family transcriptional regulator [Paenibacillus arenilitoris]MBD2869971.1 Rrf2 family transcriptional regulator [Paenibacillus arenilitoris]